MDKESLKVVSSWALIFLIPPSVLILVQLFLINKHQYDIPTTLKFLARIAGLFAVFIGIFSTAFALAHRPIVPLRKMFAWSAINALGWTFLWHMGWCAFFSLKFHELHFFVPGWAQASVLLQWWAIFFVYCFIESTTIQARLHLLRIGLKPYGSIGP